MKELKELQAKLQKTVAYQKEYSGRVDLRLVRQLNSLTDLIDTEESKSNFERDIDRLRDVQRQLLNKIKYRQECHGIIDVEVMKQHDKIVKVIKNKLWTERQKRLSI